MQRIILYTLTVLCTFPLSSCFPEDGYEEKCKELFCLYENQETIGNEDCDSMVLQLSEYFNSHGNLSEQALSEYLVGKNYYEKKEYSKALAYLDCAEETCSASDSTDLVTVLLTYIHIHRALILKRLGLEEHAVTEYRYAVESRNKCENRSVFKSSFIEYDTLSVCDIGRQQAACIYDYAQLKTRNHKSFESRTYILFVVLMLVFVWLVAFGLYYAYSRKQRQRNRENIFLERLRQLEHSKRRLIEIKTDKENWYENLIKDKEVEIESLSSLLKENEQSKDLEQLAIREESLLNADVVFHFHSISRLAQDLPTPKDWQTLAEHVSRMLPQLLAMLNTSSLREEEKRICILVRLNFTPSEISFLMGLSKQAVSTGRSRICTKLFGIKNCGAKELDRRLIEIK